MKKGKEAGHSLPEKLSLYQGSPYQSQNILEYSLDLFFFNNTLKSAYPTTSLVNNSRCLFYISLSCGFPVSIGHKYQLTP